MSSNLESLKNDLDRLIAKSENMMLDLSIKAIAENGEQPSDELTALRGKVIDAFPKQYQGWYTESYAVIRQLIPHRLLEFETLYRCDSRRKTIDGESYTIQDWLNGRRSSTNPFTGHQLFKDHTITTNLFKTQQRILKSAASRFESSLYDLRQMVEADLFDSELDAARELLKHGFARGAGAVAGVVLEKHLTEVCNGHEISHRKKNPTAADFNDLLKKNDIIDIPKWRFIQRLTDLRNLCDHNKDRAPTVDEVSELISGVEKVSKTLF